MRLTLPISALFLLAAVALSATSGIAQSSLSAMPAQSRPMELALTYNWERTNAPPGNCGCFQLNGAGLQLAVPAGKTKFAIAGDVAIVHQPNAIYAGNSLTLSTFLAGIQYWSASSRSRWQPFAEILVGGSHASGKLVASGTVADNAGLSFAGIAGGGLDLRLSRRWLWRAVQVDYLANTDHNGINDHQNILRVNSGLALRF